MLSYFYFISFIFFLVLGGHLDFYFYSYVSIARFNVYLLKISRRCVFDFNSLYILIVALALYFVLTGRFYISVYGGSRTVVSVTSAR